MFLSGANCFTGTSLIIVNYEGEHAALQKIFEINPLQRAINLAVKQSWIYRQENVSVDWPESTRLLIGSH